MVSGSFGLAMIFAGGVREMARKIGDGELDSLLTQPQSPLLTLLGSRSVASGWGDVATCVYLLALSGYVTTDRILLILFLLPVGSVFFIASGTLYNCLMFWLGPVEQLSRQLYEFLLTFSVYPQTIYSGTLRVILFTLFPAGFIGYIPVELLREFHVRQLVLLTMSALAYALIVSKIFYWGLRRYESGSRFGIVA
jgi:ABC-2 type transport system permease protein